METMIGNCGKPCPNFPDDSKCGVCHGGPGEAFDYANIPERTPHKPRIIGLYSSAGGCGKSEAAKVCREDGYKLVKFAGPLKAMFAALLVSSGVATEDTVADYIEGHLKEKPIALFGDKSPRQLMQTLGTEWGREHVSTSLWVDCALNKIAGHVKDGERVVVDDLRFKNEYNALLDAGALLVHVKRPGVTATQNHASDGALDECAFGAVVNNDGDLVDLYVAMCSIIYG